MARKTDEPPITEPQLIPSLAATGVSIARTPHALSLVFWVHTPDLATDDPMGEFLEQFIDGTGERRIISRVMLPVDVARVFARSIARALRDSGH